MSCIVTLFIVVINDIVGSVWKVGWEVKEIIEVLWVGKNIVTVNTLDSSRSVTLNDLEFLNHIVIENVYSKLVLGVSMFLDRPVSVLIVETLEEVVNILLNVVLEVQVWENSEDNLFNKFVEEENNDEDLPEEDVDTRWGHKVCVKHVPAENVTS